MSGVFGCLHFDGRPVPAELTAPMREAMGRWGPDGLATGFRGPAFMGFANLAVAPEAHHAAMPCVDAQLDTLFTASARLDNRDELCDRFAIPWSERHRVADEHLVKLAWEAWGEAAKDRLLGDWAFAAWDGARRSLFLARDPLGNTGLYYVHRPPLLAFASDPEALLALGPVERRTSAAWLFSLLTLVALAPWGETCWTGVLALLPGHALSATPEGLKVRRYWDPGQIAPARDLGDEDCLGLFLERYRAAVKVRLRTLRPCGATLSAGLDSSSVTALAAEELGRTGRRLTAFTSRPLMPADHLWPGGLADEWPLAHQLASGYPHVEHCPITAPSLSPIRALERALEAVGSPPLGANNLFWFLALMETARERGIGVLLTGQMGNATVSWHGGGDPIFWLFAAGRWDQGLRAMASWQRRHGRSWIRTVASRLLLPLARTLRPTGWRPPAAPGANQESLAGFGVRAQMARYRHQWPAPERGNPRAERCRMLDIQSRTTCPSWHGFAAAFGLEARDPTADLRLLECCLGFPQEQYFRDGDDRMLIRRAMAGIVPRELLWNPLKGRQGADLSLRLLARPAEVEAVLARFASNAEVSWFLDVAHLRGLWRELQGGAAPYRTGAIVTLLMRCILCGLFIEREQSQ